MELVNKCVSSGMLEVYFTADGKDYITPQHLCKEMLDELQVYGGESPINLMSNR